MKNFFCTGDSKQDIFGLNRVSIQDIKASLESSKGLLGCDTETSGLNFLDETLLMLQIFDGKNNYVIDCQTVDILPLKPIFESKDIIKIFHNAKFDAKFLKANGIDVENVYDTMLVEKILNCGRVGIKYSLKELLHKYFGIEMDKSVRSSFINHKGSFNKHQVLYGLEDTVKLLELHDLQMAQINKLNLNNVVRLENESVLALSDIEYNGLYLDKDVWERVAVDVKLHVDELFSQLDEIIATYPEYKNNQLDMFGGGRAATINWNSPKQVLEFMKKFDSKLESAGAPAIKHLASHPIVGKYIEYKEKSKLYTAYGLDFYKYLYSDGRVHTNFDQILDTGRVSSRSPNIQQIPADNTYRNAFKPSDSDYVVVSSDFAAQELCIIAYGSQDPVWLKVLKDGGDLHSVCAELIFGDRWLSLGKDNDERKNTSQGKKLRTHVKTINFALAYGAGPFSIARSLDITEDEAKSLIDQYYNTFPKIKGFLKKLGDYGKKHRHIMTAPPFRRIRFFEKDNDKKYISKVVRASKNTFVQGTAADMTKVALIKLRKAIQQNDWPVKVIATVHDQIDCECKRSFAEEFAKELTKIMEVSASAIIGEGLIKSDTAITENWQK